MAAPTSLLQPVLDALNAAAAAGVTAAPTRLAVVTAVLADLTVRVRFEGEESPSARPLLRIVESYPVPAVGDRVQLLASGRTWVVLGEVGGPAAVVTRLATVTSARTDGRVLVQFDGDAAPSPTLLQRIREGYPTPAVDDRVLVVGVGAGAGQVWVVLGRVGGPLPVDPPPQPPIGSVIAFAGVNAPSGWLLCDGQTVSRSTFSELFAVCGTAYGAGDGETTFRVPNLGGRFPLGVGDTRPRASTGGSSRVALTVEQLPAHDHFVQRGGGSNQVQTATGTGIYAADVQNTRTGDAGAGESHENMPPYLTLTYIVRAR